MSIMGWTGSSTGSTYFIEEIPKLFLKSFRFTIRIGEHAVTRRAYRGQPGDLPKQEQKREMIRTSKRVSWEVLAFVLCLLPGFLFSPSVLAGSITGEADRKAAIFLNFIKFVEWPAPAFASGGGLPPSTWWRTVRSRTPSRDWKTRRSPVGSWPSKMFRISRTLIRAMSCSWESMRRERRV